MKRVQNKHNIPSQTFSPCTPKFNMYVDVLVALIFECLFVMYIKKDH